MNKKIKAMNQRPDASDEEIKGYMDFASVLKKRNEVVGSSRQTSRITRTLVGLVVGVIVTSLIWIVSLNKSEKTNVTSEQKTSPSLGAVAPVDTALSLETKKESVSKGEISLQKKKAVVPGNESSSKPQVPAGEEKIQPMKSYVQAEPISGYDELYAYFNKNLVYPQEAMKDSIQGVLTITFIVNRDGKPENIEVMNSLGKALDDEAKRLIESMPEWKPAMLNGKPVPSKISVPITFQIQKLPIH